MDATRHSHLSLPRSIQDQWYLQPYSSPRGGLLVHEWLRTLELLPQEGRFRFHSSRKHYRSDQPSYGRSRLPHGYGLPLVLLLSSRYRLYVSRRRPSPLSHALIFRYAGFGVIWVTLWAGHQYNDRTPFLIAKLVLAAGLTAAYFEIEGPLEATFSFFNTVFATNWNAKEWRFRQTLDMWIVWVGMFTALAFIKIKEMRLTDRPEWPRIQRVTIIGSAITMVGYFVFELTRESKFVYNHYHPYVSILPILSFIVLRNATPYLRSTSSKFFMYFGSCSLETYIMQFHLFISGE